MQAIVDFVHNHVTFGYPHANVARTAYDTFTEAKGVCRDFAHLAITLCRCMNIPLRYCTGYLGDIGVPYDPAPMDFSAWFEAYVGDRWYTFDARHKKPRIGRILIARGRDATDVAITTSFGPHQARRLQSGHRRGESRGDRTGLSFRKFAKLRRILSGTSSARLRGFVTKCWAPTEEEPP